MRTPPLDDDPLPRAGAGVGSPRPQQREMRPSASFREHHAEIREHLEHIDAMVMRMPAETAERARTTMGAVVEFFTSHIGPHAAEEEQFLYPVADRVAGQDRFTASMRYEHRVVERWIGELAGLAAAADPDAPAFARRTQRLLGLLEAHFGAEEDVVLALLDERLSPDEFRRQVSGPAEAARRNQTRAARWFNAGS